MRFTGRYSNIQQRHLKQMLEVLGLDSIDTLIENVFAKDLRAVKALELDKSDQSISESAIHQLASQNTPMRTFIGMGYYQNCGCALLSQRILTNALWHEPYIAHQPKICQGRLEALYNFQTMILSFTGMQQTSCPMQDDALAAVEAMIMMYKLGSDKVAGSERNMFFVDRNIFAQTLDVLLTYSEGMGIEIVCDNFDEYEFCGKEFGALVQYPASNGHIHDYDDFCATAHSSSVLVCASVDLLSLTLLKSPESWGADMVVGSIQRFGLDMGFGAYNAAFLATTNEHADLLPSDKVCKDEQNNIFYIKKGKGYNVSSDQSLLAIYAGLYAMRMGVSGIYEKAIHAHSYAHTLGSCLSKMGYSLSTNQYFDTIEVVDVAAHKIEKLAHQAGINIYCVDTDIVHLSLDEKTSIEELNTLASIFAKVAGAKHSPIKSVDKTLRILHDRWRTTPLLQEEIFNSYNSDTELETHIKELETKDLALTFGLKKANSLASKIYSNIDIQRLREFTDIHPFAPEIQREGYAQLTAKLTHDFANIAGLSGCSLQATSYPSALFAGFMIIRAYHQSRAAAYRNIAFIPSGSHPNKQQAATMAGMKLVSIASTESGDIDLDELKRKTEYYCSELSCLVLESHNILSANSNNIREAIDIVHDHMALVYIDCNNINATVSFSSAGYIGADICTIDASELFELPYRDQNSGLRAISVAEHLRKFLPTHPIIATGGKEGITAIASSPIGMAILFSYLYMGLRANGGQGLREAASAAILSANYMAKELSSHFKILNTNTRGYVDSRVVIELDQDIEPQKFMDSLLVRGYYIPKLTATKQAVILESCDSKRAADMLIEAVIESKQNNN